MASESRMEWVEIIEPRTKEHMYANLTTGECVWDPPPGVPVKKTDNNQWWELFDQNTSRFYYYNATSQKTVWHRPTDCDIIPLAKLQTLKQNTEPVNSRDNADRKTTETKKKETVSTQTQTPTATRINRFNNRESPSSVPSLHVSDGCKAHGSSLADPQMSPLSPSPSAVARRHYHHHHHHNSSSSNNNAHPSRHETPSSGRRQHNHSQDSGRSSDSSVSHSRTSLESSSYRLLDSPHRQHHRAGQTGSPGGASLELRAHKSGTIEGVRTQKQPETAPPVGLSLSTSTPVFKKKSLSGGDSEKNKNGASSPYRDFEGYRQEAPPYRPPDMQFAFKPTGDKYGSLVESSGRSYQRRRPDKEPQQRERVNSLDKSSAYYAPWPKDQPSAGSIGRRHQYGCSASLSEANVREMYGAMLAEPPVPFARGNQNRQKSLDVSERQSDRRPSKCNSDLESSQQPIARSYSFVQQQKHKLQQQQSQSRSRRDKDDDSMHERYLVGQNQLGDFARQRLDSNSSSNSSRSNSSNSDDEAHDTDEGKKRRSNGNPSPPASPYYGNILVDPDHLLPLQHYILQQAKLSEPKLNRPISMPVLNRFNSHEYKSIENTRLAMKHRSKRTRPKSMLAINRIFKSLLQSQLELNPYSPGCYKFGDPLLVEEGDDSLDEEGGHAEESRTRTEDDSDDQFADDEAASNHEDSSSQEYLEDPYADLANYDTSGLATYYSTTETITRSRGTPPPPPVIPTQTEARENVTAVRPMSLPAPSVIKPRPLSALGVEDPGTTSGGDIEKYAQDNLNLNCRVKGLKMLFRKKASVRDILSWTKDPIPQPMLVVVDGEKSLKKEALHLFRLVQVYMGDRRANVGMTLDGVAMELVNTILSKPPLRDELYVQICRQTTENPRKESLRRGWELMAICLAFVPPSATFEPYLDGYMNRHRDPNFQFPEVAKWPIHVQVSHYATVGCQRLRRIGANGKRSPRKATCEDIDQARVQIFRASMFGATLSEVMALQRDRFPKRQLPWIQTMLTRQVLIRGGTQTEGIFRVSADADEVNCLKSFVDKFEEGDGASQDAHAPASLLKLWVRELYEPLIPDSFYAECVAVRHDVEGTAQTVSAIVDRLPELNKRVLCHLIQFLQIFARPEVVARTKMDSSNLAMVMAPNILRCTSQEPRVILENTRKEMAFVRALIETLDTTWVDELH